MVWTKKCAWLATTALTFLAQPALAQGQAPAPKPADATDATDAGEDIVVTGYRASLELARDLKRKSTIIQDSIASDDIAAFPDLNLAEALQRLPGVAINREAGEGRRVSLRGLGPDFTRVQLDGMEVLGNVDSPQDADECSTGSAPHASRPRCSTFPPSAVRSSPSAIWRASHASRSPTKWVLVWRR